MRTIPEWQGKALLIILLFLCLFLRFPDFFHTPNRVIDLYGDAYKAYTAPWYHIKYDDTYSHFEGMNHPYGEHVIPADTQPLISNTLKWLKNNLVDLSDYTIAIINWSMLLGLILAAWFFYLIFRANNVSIWYSIIASIGLTFLSPQVHRIPAHFGLAHPEVIPILLYLLMRFDQKGMVKTSLWIAFVVWAYSMIHFYFFAIMAFTVGFYFVFSFLGTLNWKRIPFYGLHFVLQLILPLTFFVFWMYYGDPIDDRTSFPYGFFVYRAYWAGILTSWTQPHFQAISTYVNIPGVDFEGQVYIGLTAIMVFFFLLGRWLFQLFRKPVVQLQIQHQHFFNLMFFVGLVLLLFSLGYPFIIPGFEDVLDFTGPIKQFRSIGRFAWTFFAIINVIALLHWYHWGIKQKRLPAKVLLWGLPLLVLGTEAYFSAQARSMGLEVVERFKEGQKFTDLNIDYDKYQAIITAPHYNIGSDNFWFSPEGFILNESLTLSVQTGLPVTSAMLTRTSLGQTINQLQLVMEPYRHPQLLEDCPADKPFLLLWDEREAMKESWRYLHLLENAIPLYAEERLKIYEIPFNYFDQKIEAKVKQVRNEMQRDSLYSMGDRLSNDSLGHFIYNNFDTASQSKPYWGAGGFEGKMNELNILFDGKIPGAAPNKRHWFSMWMFMNQDRYPRAKLNFLEYDAVSGDTINTYTIGSRRIVNTFDQNGWGLLELLFETKRSDSHIRFDIHREQLGDSPIYLDELLIRPDSTHIYKETSAYLYKDNRWYPKKGGEE